MTEVDLNTLLGSRRGRKAGGRGCGSERGEGKTERDLVSYIVSMGNQGVLAGYQSTVLVKIMSVTQVI